MSSLAKDTQLLPLPGAGTSSSGADRNGSGSGARDKVVRDVIRGLYEGRYEPGQRLQEAQLTASYGISRGPVREAIYALAAMNVLELVPQCGAQVRVVSIREAIDTLIVARHLIGLSARLAAERFGDTMAEAKLDAALQTIASFDASDMSAAYALARDAFYGAITNMAANSELRRLLPTVRVHLIRTQFRSILRKEDGRRLSDYRRIAAAIRAGEAAKAEAAARAHLSRSIDLLKAHQAKSD